ncbi:PhzF family phenazine biosynthesis protein [Acinetobacter sp. SwsAc6]|jgi:PhzF family phenazine biosynthesis protein|uniref:PhzF family phenazine biosynthesis protein n=1 Tax=Acinetobacter TaxID=469 RepID=UPI000D11B3DC|nr:MULTISPECIES: PhzF family phenazine biosynthesis protein [Acinetobacter]NWK74886.1 PhzF family phenazine biosynthesis protein [Acinetobacter sp. SwsAc6]QCO21804.1 PhzF family phenazine biosynthesis isomerase [Acinetobacter cumulans]RFS32726.1 PhzF family phenazine biosynthesis protein [Acinetobacter sp. SWAC5]RKG43756.1 PhzF family phenazine biosynthesis protein [Acinetobacter cumulans]RKG48102.1 PhzF family phenazine biosynthesis protein [Acinetobacter cumulans]
MKMYQVDAFTDALFKGNPAAVLVLDEWLGDELMQNIALENNLSETAFVKSIDAENFEIRWFTPTTEVDFCGHATLASSFVLFKDYTSAKKIYFHVKNLGIFIVEQEADGKIKMNFPQRKASLVTEYPDELRQALTKPFKNVYLNAQAYIVEYESVQDVLDEQPNLELLKTLGKIRTAITASELQSPTDVAITSLGEQYDCVSRYFAPANGINEDPVTGSIHTAIAPLWAEKLLKNSLLAYQASARGGALYCTLLDNDRIEIAGYAKLYMQAEINVDQV